MTVVLIEHELGVVERLCSPVIVLAQGRVLMQGEMARVSRQPRGAARPTLSASDRRPAMLVVESVSAGYGGHAVVHDVSLAVARREIACVVGPNGAGKSTLLARHHRATRSFSADAFGCGARTSRGPRRTSWCGGGSPGCRSSTTCSPR